MTQGVVLLDVAQELIRERLRQAAQDALVRQLPPPAVRVGRIAAPRLWLAGALRNFAVRLDPSLSCERCLALPVSR